MNNINKKVLCGIVTYNPEIDRFTECIDELKTEIDHILIYDNASQNIDEIEKLVDKFLSNYEIVKMDSNNGIASGLKYIMNYAINNSYDYVITLDQDSIMQHGLIDKYLENIEDDEVAALTCIIIDRETEGIYKLIDSDKIEDCNFAITSGFFIKISSYKLISGYDENLFIDNVDFDLCCQLRKVGFKIKKIPFFGIYHEIGHSKSARVFGKNISSYMHDAKRKYYIGRNTIYELRKFPEYYTFFKQYRFLIKLILKILLLENNKVEKIKSIINGIMDGYKIEIQK